MLRLRIAPIVAAKSTRIAELETHLQERTEGAQAWDALAVARLQDINAKADRIAELERRLAQAQAELDGATEAFQLSGVPVVVAGRELTLGERVRWMLNDANNTMEKWETSNRNNAARIAELEKQRDADPTVPRDYVSRLRKALTAEHPEVVLDAAARVVKERDDTISASRYALMAKRFASTEPQDEDDYNDGNRTRNTRTGY